MEDTSPGSGCLALAELVAYCDGLLSGEEAEACEGHLQDCDPCRGLVEAWAQAADRFGFPGVTARGERTPLRTRMRWAAAAALLAAASGAAWFSLRDPSAVGGTVEIAAAPGNVSSSPVRAAISPDAWLEVPAGAQAVLRIPGAGTVWVAARGRIRVGSIRSDGRVVLDLSRGEVQVRGEGGAPGFRIRTPAATIDEVGTEYDVWLVPLGEVLDIVGGAEGVIVRVLSGEVRLHNAQGGCRLLPGHLGCAVAGRAPEFLESASCADGAGAARDRLRALAESSPGPEGE